MPASALCRLVIALVLSFCGFVSPAASAPRGAPLLADQAFKLGATRQGPDRLRLEWTIAPGYYLYNDALKAVSGAQPLDLTPESQGKLKDDPTYGTTTIYEGRLVATLAGAAEQGNVSVTYQGCQDGGICYPPVTRSIDLSTLAIAGGKAQPAATMREWQPKAEPPATAEKRSGITLATDSGGMVAPLLEKGGVPLVLGSFLLFGLALAFTPCVFPMYPILAGALARAGERLTPLRGFTLSAVYVLAMAASFGLLGIAAAYSGKNLQVVLQAPLAIGATAALFVILALSMFGMFELSLPSRWINALGRAGSSDRGSLASTALLGFTSALIVGPCVTAPLAGALVYIAQTGDMALGAAALFALGIGKGIPLIAFGTLGQRALPKAGPWMDGVKRGFGIIFLAAAVWIASRIVSGPVALALWAVLAVGAGTWLGAFDTLTAASPASRRTGKAAGIAALIYGVLLAIGAASGSGDPLRPLERFAGAAGLPAAPADIRFNGAADLASLEGHLAKAGGKPTLVYLTADWCLTCKTIDGSVLPDPRVRASLGGFNLVKLDVSDNSPAGQQAMAALGAFGPPTMIFVDQEAKEQPGTRLVGDITADALLSSAGMVSVR